jgi:hypothetical protein
MTGRNQAQFSTGRCNVPWSWSCRETLSGVLVGLIKLCKEAGIRSTGNSNEIDRNPMSTIVFARDNSDCKSSPWRIESNALRSCQSLLWVWVRPWLGLASVVSRGVHSLREEHLKWDLQLRAHVECICLSLSRFIELNSTVR